MSKTLITVLLLGASLAFSHAQNETTPTPKPRPKIYDITFQEDTDQECSMRFIRFEGAYLRGVKSPNLISFNESSYSDCQKKCCYETRFECRSFSYFRPLRQCFIMNLTRANRKVELIDVKGYIHVQIMPDIEVTTAMMETTVIPDEETTAVQPETTVADEDVTTAPEFWVGTTTPDPDTFVGESESPETTKSTPFVEEGSGIATEIDSESNTPTTTPKIPDGPDKGVINEFETPEKIVSEECPISCENEGQCLFRPKSDGEPGLDAFCECQEGFEGEKCETNISEEGFPIWIIIVAVLGGLILILLIVGCILLQVYKKKKGEYKVVEWARKWARRGKKPKKPDNPGELAHIEEGDNDHTSPTTSIHSINNSNVTSSTSSRTAV